MVCLLLFLTAFSVFFQVIRNTNPEGFGDAYRAALAEYQQMSIEAAANAVEEERDSMRHMSAAFLWYNETDESLKEFYAQLCAETYGEDFAAQFANVDLSQQALEQYYLRQSVLDVLSEQLAYLQQYPEYLDTVHRNAIQMQGLQIFNTTGSFSKRNIALTDQDFPTRDMVPLSLTSTLSTEYFLDDAIHNLCIFVWMLAIILVFLQERKSGLWSLTHGSKNGRAALGAKRVLLLLAGAAGGTLIISGGTLTATCLLYGGMADPGCVVQSSAAFQSLPEVMTFGGFFVRYFLLKVLGMWLVGLLLWCILQAINNLPLAIAASGVFVIMEYALFMWIPDSYAIVALRYANLFALINVEQVMLQYRNINLFDYPIRGSNITLILLPIMLSLCILAAIWLQCKKKPVAQPNRLLRWLDRFRIPFSKLDGHLRLLGAEAKKILISQKGFVVFALLLFWTLCYAQAPSVDTGLYDATTAGYISEFSGKITEETIQRIDDKIAEYANWADNEYTASSIAALATLKTDAMESLAQDDGRWILNPVPYAAICNQNMANYQRTHGLIAILAVVLLVSGVFPYERQNQTDTLLRTVPKGRSRLVAVKLSMVFVLTVLVWIIMSVWELKLTIEAYGNFDGLAAPMQSLSYFVNFPLHIPIWAGLLIFYCLRLLTMLSLAAAACALSGFCKTVNSSILLCCAILALPACLSAVGMPFADSLSFIRLFSPLECSIWEYAASLIICIAAGAVCFLTGRRKS